MGLLDNLKNIDIKKYIPFGKSKGSESISKNKPSASNSFISRISTQVISMLSEYSVQQEEVVGVDITPTSVRLAQLSKKDDEDWIVEKLAYRHLERIDDIKNGGEKISQEIIEAYKSGKFSTPNAAVSLPVSSSIVKVITMPLMTDDEMKKAIEYDSLWENLTQLPDALDKYSIFHQTIRKDNAANVMDVLFVASKLDDVNQYIQIVKDANLTPVVLDVRCFALRNAFETKNMKAFTEAPLAILEIGNYENYLLILKGENPFVNDIFVGAQDKAFLAKDETDESQLLQLVERFTMQIKQNLDSYSSRFKTDKVQNLFIVSQSPSIEKFTEELSKKMKDLTVVLLDPFNNMTVPKNITEKLEATDNVSAFTAVAGLATRKLDIFGYYQKVTGVNNINLLPNRDNIRRSQKAKFLSGFVLIGLIGFLIVLSIWFGGTFFYKKAKNNTALSDYTIVETQLDGLQMNMAKLKSENSVLIDGLKLSETATTNQKAAAKVLIDLAEQAGFNIALSAIVFDGTTKYEIEGEALSDGDVINYLTRIRQTDIFEKVVLEKSFIAKEGSNIKSFLINISVKPELMKAKNLQNDEDELTSEEKLLNNQDTEGSVD
jgi:type IV pilus assembly protein PilN